MFDVNRGDTGDQTIAPLRAAWIDRDSKRVILDSAQLTPTSELPALGRTPVDAQPAPVVPPPLPADEEAARERQREARELARGERERHLDEEVMLGRQFADLDEPPPPPSSDAPRIERRTTDDRPDSPR